MFVMSLFLSFSVKLIFESLPSGAIKIFGEHTDLHICFDKRGRLRARVSFFVVVVIVLLPDFLLDSKNVIAGACMEALHPASAVVSTF